MALCTICFETIDDDNAADVQELECGHRFHTACILSWARSTNENHQFPFAPIPSSSSPADDASSSIDDDDAWASWEDRSTGDVNLHVTFLVSEAKERRRREGGSRLDQKCVSSTRMEEEGRIIRIF